MEKVSMLIVLLPFLVLAQTQNQCIPECVEGDVPPNKPGGLPCLCTVNVALPGCTVPACKPGEDASGAFTCQCTPESHQSQCVSLRCTNGTEAHSSVATASSQPIDQATVPSCNNLCNCGVQPADCTTNSGDPIDGAPACSCNPIVWSTGCTLKPCQKGDTGEDDYFCLCTDSYAPDFCLSPQCKSRFL